MKKENITVKKTCSFYISEYHLVTMLLPYIKQKIDEKIEIRTLLEDTIQTNMETLLASINLNGKDKEKVLGLNWKSMNPYKYENVEKELNTIALKTEQLNIIVTGKNQYIDIVNSHIEKWIQKNKKRLKSVTINNCYEVTQFNNNIKAILDKHDKVLNTSGEQEIEQVFDGYKRGYDNIINA